MSEALPLVLVMPVFHEQDTIARTLTEVREKVAIPHRLLVVHDTDDDPTLPVVRALAGEHPGLELVKNDLGRGVLNAIKKGFQVACAGQGDPAARPPSRGGGASAPEHDAAVLVVMADLSDDLSSVEPMYRLLCAGHDLVAGSRYCPGGAQHGAPLLKSTLSRLAGRSLHALTSLPVHDATNAFRLYRASFLRQVRIESTGGFELSLELTIKAWAGGFRLAEVPTTWTERAAGKSKFKLAAWLPRYLRWYGAALAYQAVGKRP